MQPLTATPARDEQWPAWSPDGDRVVFAERGGAPGASLAWIDVATRAETLLASSGRAISSSGRASTPEAAASSRSDAARTDAARRCGSRRRTLPPRRLTRETGCEELKPFFARAGDVVVFTRQCGGAPREVFMQRRRRVAALPGAQAGADEHSARPSPTRDEVAFVSDRGGTRDVFLVALADGASTNLTATPDRDEFAPRWSPDGERLVLTTAPPQPRGRDGDRLDPRTTRLVVVDRRGHVLFETAGMMADWMPAF